MSIPYFQISKVLKTWMMENEAELKIKNSKMSDTQQVKAARSSPHFFAKF